MRNWYPLAAAGSLAAIALVVLIVVLVRAADDGSPPAAPTETPASTVTATATPTPSVLPSATHAPTAVSATSTPAAPTPTPTTSLPATGTLFEHGPRNTKLVALTFDMGGRVDPALDIMNWLIERDIHATIFMTGSMADNQNTDAGRDVLRLVEANPALFDLGNHSYTHPDFRELGAEEMRDELARTEQAIARTISTSARPWFRPPFGGYDADVVQAVAKAGYPATIMWDIDTIDWRPEEDGGPTAQEIADKVVTRAQGGSIVLMHLGGFNTLEALPAIIAGLEAKGLQPATLTEMLGH